MTWAASLGCGGYLSGLRRTRIGGFQRGAGDDDGDGDRIYRSGSPLRQEMPGEVRARYESERITDAQLELSFE